MQLFKLHGAHSCTVPTQGNWATEKTRGRLSRGPCALSSSSSLSEGAWPSSSGLIKIESSTRPCSPVAAAVSVSAASLGDVEGDEATSMEWLSPASGNPMEVWLRKDDEPEGDAWREECGVVAIFGDPEASRLCYLSLHALQHRGQEGAGIVTANEHTLHAVTGNRGFASSSCYSSTLESFLFDSVAIVMQDGGTGFNLGFIFWREF